MKTRSPGLILFIACALGALALLKAAGAAIGFSQAAADASEVSVIGEARDGPVESPAVAPTLAPGKVERRILERLAARRTEIEQRERSLLTREAVVAASEVKLARQLEELETARSELQALRDEREASENESVEALVSAYEKMKARDAAAIFNELDTAIMLAVASKMRTQALAGVLAEMAPAKARALTVMLAEREALGGDIGDETPKGE
ncbi:MAG: hypothetical protein AAFW81_03775 [Pseudomonadota bacterium]